MPNKTLHEMKMEAYVDCVREMMQTHGYTLTAAIDHARRMAGEGLDGYQHGQAEEQARLAMAQD